MKISPILFFISITIISISPLRSESILREMTVQLDENLARIFYAEHSGRGFLIDFGPVVVLVLEKEDAVVDWRALIGPTDASKAKVSHPNSIRALCGMDMERNCVHGSDSRQSATREVSFFFGEVPSTGDVPEHDEL
ncbi:hypothetical protein MKW94_011547 [Papaver nudicaule]|uniref:Nucleoside diphosphate kinase-like domain-containing protein n=1 Tax=Papaver nudicaule TaxID=74823 RepID=A0AA41VGE1_PAPNU|nr:hypothetical protein [Papaver nudicaule]